MLPLTFFEDRRMSAGSGVVTVAFFVMFGLFFLFTLYLQFVRAYSPLSAGLATLPLAVTLVAIAPRSAALAARIGSGLVMAVGFLCIAGGFGVLSFLSTDTPYLVLVVALVLLGAGLSLTAAPATACIMNAVPQAKAGVGSAVNDTTREVGGALGIAVLGSISNAVYRSSINLDGIALPPPLKGAAEESVGAATFIARSLPEGGRELAARAGSAFTHSFSVTSRVAVAVTLVSAAVVARAFSHKSELAAAGQPSDPPTPPIPVEVAPEAT
jgi:MFS family permease